MGDLSSDHFPRHSMIVVPSKERAGNIEGKLFALAVCHFNS